MSAFTPTAEQLLCVAAATDTKDNLLINALAGAAKTSTLVLIAEALKSSMILCLAFNKKIAEEMKKRLPPNCESRTLNSLGHAAWSEAIGRRCIVDTKKNYSILSELISKMEDFEKKQAFEEFADTLRALAQGKTSGWVPDGHFTDLFPKPLMDDALFFASLEDEPSDQQCDLLREAMIASIGQSYQGRIDYDDQLFMPTVFQARFPFFGTVLTDETQDFSELNHAMLQKIVKKRLIAVGDPCQAIYAFRGAHHHSMSLLQELFNMKEFYLTITFRCPVTVVQEAQWRAPAMRWRDGAPQGRVASLAKWGLEALPETAAIICRNNAPLFALAIRLLRHGRYPELLSGDIVKGLIKVLQKFGPLSLSQELALDAIDGWEAEKLVKSRNPALVSDRAECLRIFVRQGPDLGSAIAYAEHVMNASGSLKLMTAHKSKGLEFDHVFILDRDLIRLGRGQEDNILYVAQTRAKETLTYITSDGFDVQDDD